MRKRQHPTGDRTRNRSTDSCAQADAGNEIARRRRHNQADQIHKEKRTQGSRRKMKRRGGEIESDPREDADQRKKHIESYGEGRDEPAAAKESLHLVGKRGKRVKPMLRLGAIASMR